MKTDGAAADLTLMEIIDRFPTDEAARAHLEGRGIWAVDRGGDRKKLLEPLLDRQERFVIRSTGKRFVVDRKNIKRSVSELGARCRLRYQARIIKVQDGQEKTYDLRYGVEPIRLVGRDRCYHGDYGGRLPDPLREGT